MHPAGVLEQTLVERIALSLWRQQRLVRTERASIELQRKPNDIDNAVTQELRYQHKLEARDLVASNDNHIHGYQDLIEQYDKLDRSRLNDLGYLQTAAPLIYQRLRSDALSSGLSAEAYLQQYPQPIFYIGQLVSDCREQLKQFEQQALVGEVAQLVKNKRALPAEKCLKTLAKYQVMLDNELYKAMRALREAQDWRMKTLNVVDDVGFVLSDA